MVEIDRNLSPHMTARAHIKTELKPKTEATVFILLSNDQVVAIRMWGIMLFEMLNTGIISFLYKTGTPACIAD